MKLINMMARLLDDNHLTTGKKNTEATEKIIISNHALWADVIEEADVSMHKWLAQALSEDLAAPCVYYELADDKGVVVAEGELAWPEAKVVLLTDNQKKISQPKFEQAGWKVFCVDTDVEQVKLLIE